MRRHFLAAAALLSGITAARADGLEPIQALPVNLGPIAGIAYYTVEADGFHVVATLAQSEARGKPVRVRAVLNAGQSVTFSTPGDANSDQVTVRIARFGDSLVVRGGETTD